MKKLNQIFSIFTVIALLVACLFISIDTQAFNQSYYEKKYTQLNTAENIGMSNEALFEATYALLDYIKDKRDDISCIQEVNGRTREVFDERETAHMVDVKALYQNAFHVCALIVIIGIGCLAILLYQLKKKELSVVSFILDMKHAFFQVVFSFILVIGFLLFYALVDFNRFWTTFHEIFFSNDLWLLDPRVSIMINMFPEEFFFGMVMNIVGMFIISFVGISLCCYLLANKELKKRSVLIENDEK
ncbi:MAG: TIGR01906 family membrane protein [Traorella sp.]